MVGYMIIVQIIHLIIKVGVKLLLIHVLAVIQNQEHNVIEVLLILVVVALVQKVLYRVENVFIQQLQQLQLNILAQVVIPYMVISA